MPAVGQHAGRLMDPLPDLRSGDLGGGRIFHQVIDGHAAVAPQPGGHVLDAHVDVLAQARARLFRPWDRQQVLGRHLHVIAAAVDLVGFRHLASNAALAMPTKPGWATHVPS